MHSYIRDDNIHCVYAAPDEDAVRRHVQQGRFPPTESRAASNNEVNARIAAASINMRRMSMSEAPSDEARLLLKDAGSSRRLACKINGLRSSSDIKDVDRHRGGGLPPTPATPPYVRVRIRRFEKLRRHSSTSEGRPSDLKYAFESLRRR